MQIVEWLCNQNNYNYLIGYLCSDYKVKPRHIMLQKTSMYHESYDNQTKWMQVLIEDYDLLKNYNDIWNKVNADIKKELDRFCLEKKTNNNSKPKSDYDKAIHFHNKEMLNVGPNYAYLAVITIDSVFKEDETYQPKVFLKERKYNEKS